MWSYVFWLSLAIACLPSLAEHISRVWNLEQYHYLPALVLALGLLVSIRWDRTLRMPKGWSPYLTLTLGCLVLVVGFLAKSSWVGAAAFVFLLGSWLLSQRNLEGQSLGHLWPPAFMLMPLPLGLDTNLTHWLQMWSSRVSSFSLDLMQVPHALFGNVIELASGKLFVEEACSGVQSLFTVLFVAVLLVAVLRRSCWLIPAYLVAAIFWAGLMNVIRIIAIAYVQHSFGYDLAHGWPHAMLGYACLGIACILLLSTDRLLQVLFFPIEASAGGDSEPNPLVFLWNRLFAPAQSSPAASSSAAASSAALSSDMTRGLAGLFAKGVVAFAWVAFLCYVVRFASSTEAVAASASAHQSGRFLIAPVALASKEESMPGFIQVTHEEQEGTVDQPFGEHADIWNGSFGEMPVTMALSQPYTEWHDLCVCYTSAGLKLNDRQIVDKDDWNYLVARFISDDGHISYVWFSSFDVNGQAVNAPDSGVLTRWLSRLQAGDSLFQRDVTATKVAMVQLKVDVDGFLPADSVEALTNLHLRSRELLKNVLAGQ